MQKIKIIESPRDAMQGLTRFIPTEDKARYITAVENKNTKRDDAVFAIKALPHFLKNISQHSD